MLFIQLSEPGLLVLAKDLDQEVVELEKIVSGTSLSKKEVITRFRGLNGSPWPKSERYSQSLGGIIRDGDGLVSLEHIPKVMEYLEDVKNSLVVEMLLIATENSKLVVHPFHFMGYDYAYYNYDPDYYKGLDVWSIIKEEIIFGTVDEMKIYYHKLNQNLLFDTVEQVQEMENVRKVLVKQGQPLETAHEDYFCIPIFGLIK